MKHSASLYFLAFGSEISPKLPLRLGGSHSGFLEKLLATSFDFEWRARRPLTSMFLRGRIRYLNT
jgi:hypothetical protein